MSDGVELVPSETTPPGLADFEFDFNAASFLRCSRATVRASPARHDRSDGRALAVEAERRRGVVLSRIPIFFSFVLFFSNVCFQFQVFFFFFFSTLSSFTPSRLRFLARKNAALPPAADRARSPAPTAPPPQACPSSDVAAVVGSSHPCLFRFPQSRQSRR